MRLPDILRPAGPRAARRPAAFPGRPGRAAGLPRAALLAAVLATALPPAAAAEDATGPTLPVAQAVPSPPRLVPAGPAGAAMARGTLRGRADRDFLIPAGAGQELAVALDARNPSACFNVLPPGSGDAAMFVGSVGGRRFRGTAPVAGDYVVRVYLVRSAARRNESATFTLTARVTGDALVPLAPDDDAVIPGTSFHARGTVGCAIPYRSEVRSCEASVVRYGRDGTATVELRGPRAFARRILFVRGTPIASDATGAPTSTRTGDTTVVRIGDEERYEIPDALVNGG